MNIKELAKEARLTESNNDGIRIETGYWVEELTRFAALVRADERDRATRENAYVLAEREECAKMVDHILREGGGTYGDAIRARGEA